MGAEDWISQIADKNFREWSVIPTSALVFAQEVHELCSKNQCGAYGTSWACPPAIGSLEQCRDRCMAYEQMLVFTAVYDLEDSYDIDGMQKGAKQFREICIRLHKMLKENGVDHEVLANGGCHRCRVCTYPKEPCRFPDELLPSLEGQGIYVNQLAERAGVRYINGANTVTYFGAVLY